MREELRKRTDLFINNTQIINQKFNWDYAIVQRITAFLYADAGKEVDVEGIKRAKEIVKKHTGIFSAFKDSTFLMIAAIVALKEEPELYFKNVLKIYDLMKQNGFYGSNYLTIAALTIAKKAEEYNYDAVIRNTKNYYDRMEKEHPFLTTTDDYCFAAMLGLSELGLDSTIKEIEGCYQMLKPHFFSSNSVQSLCHVLAFGEEEFNSKCSRVLKINDTLKIKKCKLGSDGELTSLGILALVTDDIDKITDDIVEVSEYIYNKKGFGYFSISNSERNRYAAALVSSTYVQNLKDNILGITLTNSLTNILIAQETAMIVAISASTAAAASSASN